MPEENLKRGFSIIHSQCIDSLLSKLVGDRNYESIERDQHVIGILKIIKGVMFKFDIDKEITQAM